MSYELPPSISEDMMDDDALPSATTTEDFAEDSETCEAVVERTGEVCGRDVPCMYHD